jgi:hypothetical protein
MWKFRDSYNRILSDLIVFRESWGQAVHFKQFIDISKHLYSLFKITIFLERLSVVL